MAKVRKKRRYLGLVDRVAIVKLLESQGPGWWTAREATAAARDLGIDASHDVIRRIAKEISVELKPSRLSEYDRVVRAAAQFLEACEKAGIAPDVALSTAQQQRSETAAA